MYSVTIIKKKSHLIISTDMKNVFLKFNIHSLKRKKNTVRISGIDENFTSIIGDSSVRLIVCVILKLRTRNFAF